METLGTVLGTPVPTWGKVLAPSEKAACPTWASMLPIYCSFTILAHGCGFVVGKAKATREM